MKDERAPGTAAREAGMTTPRLALRRFTEADWPALHRYLSDEAVVRFEPYPPMDEGASRAFARGAAASPHFWAVCLKGEKEPLGQVYLAKGEQAVWTLGYVFGRPGQGRGYATEAVRALVGAAFRRWGAHRIEAHCNPENAPSWRLLERLGFRREGRLRQNVAFKTGADGAPIWQDTYLYGLLAEEWTEE